MVHEFLPVSFLSFPRLSLSFSRYISRPETTPNQNEIFDLTQVRTKNKS